MARSPSVPRPTAERLLALTSRFVKARVAVIGDLLADEFIYGRVERVSREAPVLILRYDTTIVLPGGAGNAANNAAALGGRVRVAGLAGRDEAGTRMLAALHDRVGTSAILRPAAFATPVKTRILAGGVHSAKQQVVRIDRMGRPGGAAIGRRIDAALARATAAADLVIVSDYGGGKTAGVRSEADLTGRVSKMFDQAQREVASSFVGMRRIPITAAATSMSRTAIHARPTELRTMFLAASPSTTTTDSVSRYFDTGLSNV